MNCMKPGVLIISSLLLAAPLAPAQVYKVIDEDGNVVYTDQPPPEGAEPMELRELSVVETPVYPSRIAAEDTEEEPVSLRDLRREYRDFRISSPMPEQTFWGTENKASLSWTTDRELRPGMVVVMYLDGEAMDPTTSSAMSTGQLDRGEHSVRAELYDGQQRRVATADTVTFHVKQQSSLNRAIGGG